MLEINCPWCGMRNESEFSYGGEAHIVRPHDPGAISDEQWADYLYMRENPKGIHHEQWRHSQGCGRWLNVARHTVSYEILSVYCMNEASSP